MKPAVQRWNQRFAATEDYIFGTEPNAFLVEQTKQWLQPGMQVLAVADGEGRNGVWLAGQNLEVWSVDAAPAATEKAKRLAKERGVDLHVVTADISQWNWDAQQFDAVIAIFIQFANPKLRAQIFDGMKRATKPGGLILIQGYGLKQLEYKTGGPDIPEHLYTLDLMRESFQDTDILLLREYDAEIQEGDGHQGMSALVDLVARKS